ncbi:MAG: hypothetical protein N2Z84_00725 [Atribacterota bacterium]|nr:hypothetical protein [Atribacterota bacterium]
MMQKVALWVGVVAFSLSILVFSAFSQEESILDFSLCRGLDKDGLPLERIDKFSTEDERVVFWVFLQAVQKGDEAKWEFIGPAGELYESTLIFEEDKKYVGVQGELNLTQNQGRLHPGNWQARFYLKEEKLLEIPFTLVESTIAESKSLEEAVGKTVSLLKQFGYQVLEVNISEDDQAYIRMTMAGKSIDQSFWNQIGSGFEALERIFPEVSWLLVQLIMGEEYLLSFQVKASDFDYWRKGYLNSDDFWKKKVHRYVYNIKEKKDVDAQSFYMEKFKVVY